MAESSCEKCKFRATYDRNPKSILGRIWRWHASWCPGWKKYILSLNPEEKKSLAERYNMAKFM